MIRNVIYVIERHDQLLHLWRSQNITNLRVVHVDFHCDMRGLLINRQTQQAYPIGDMGRGVDQGNFLTHAIMEGYVQRMRWVHRIPGGRRYDVGTVKYETDLTAQLPRWLLALKGQRGIPIDYQVMQFEAWPGLEKEEFLDIDWDFFACTEYPINTIDFQVETFLKMDFGYVPEQTSVCYSPDFSHPSREQFEAFIHRLAQLFKAEVIRLPAPQPETQSSYKKYIPKPLYLLLRNIYYQTNLWLKQRKIY